MILSSNQCKLSLLKVPQLSRSKNMQKSFVVATLGVFFMSGFQYYCQASTDPGNSQAAIKKLRAYAAKIDSASAVQLSVDCTVDNDKYCVDGIMQKPDLYNLHVSQSGTEVARLVCDGKTITEYDMKSGKYITTDTEILKDRCFDNPLLNPLQRKFYQNCLHSESLVTIVDELKSELLIGIDTYDLFINVSKREKGVTSAISMARIIGDNGETLNQITQTTSQTTQLEPNKEFTAKTKTQLAFNANSGLLRSSKTTFSSNETADLKGVYIFKKLVFPAQNLPDSQFQYTPPSTAVAYTIPASEMVYPEQAPVPLLAAGVTAPDFTVESVDHKPVKLSDFAGKIVVIDFWATWCGPCQASLPHLDDISKLYAPKGVVFLPICVADTRNSFDDWLPKHKQLTMSFLFDPHGEADEIDSKLYNVTGIPTQFVIGKDGKIVANFVGYSDPNEKQLSDALDKLLATTN